MMPDEEFQKLGSQPRGGRPMPRSWSRSHMRSLRRLASERNFRSSESSDTSSFESPDKLNSSCKPTLTDDDRTAESIAESDTNLKIEENKKFGEREKIINNYFGEEAAEKGDNTRIMEIRVTSRYILRPEILDYPTRNSVDSGSVEDIANSTNENSPNNSKKNPSGRLLRSVRENKRASTKIDDCYIPFISIDGLADIDNGYGSENSIIPHTHDSSPTYQHQNPQFAKA